MSRNVLVIEDDRDIARLLELHLKDEGYAVSVASLGKAGLRQVLAKPRDLVILDLILPGMDGLKVCRGIRNREEYTPVLMLTAKSTDVDRIVGLSMGIEEDLPFAFGDIGLVERVLQNLVDNALRHTPEGGEIAIAAEGSRSGLTVRVSDTGYGISPDRLSRMLDPAATRYGNAVEDGDGTGLGLIIARRILELHGSDQKAESAVGFGTTFEFTLPVTKT